MTHSRASVLRDILDKLTDEIASLQKKVEQKAVLMGALQAELDQEQGAKEANEAVVTSILKDKQRPLYELIRETLASSVRPMRVGEIAVAIHARGIGTNSKRGIGPQIATNLVRHRDLFEAVERGLYQLKKEK